jgi:hypothetical protein
VALEEEAGARHADDFSLEVVPDGRLLLRVLRRTYQGIEADLPSQIESAIEPCRQSVSTRRFTGELTVDGGPGIQRGRVSPEVQSRGECFTILTIPRSCRDVPGSTSRNDRTPSNNWPHDMFSSSGRNWPRPLPDRTRRAAAGTTGACQTDDEACSITLRTSIPAAKPRPLRFEAMSSLRDA